MPGKHAVRLQGLCVACWGVRLESHCLTLQTEVWTQHGCSLQCCVSL